MEKPSYLERAEKWVKSEKVDDELLKSTIDRFSTQIAVARSKGQTADVSDLKATIDFLAEQLHPTTAQELVPGRDCTEADPKGDIDCSILVDHHFSAGPGLSTVERAKALAKLKNHPNLQRASALL